MTDVRWGLIASLVLLATSLSASQLCASELPKKVAKQSVYDCPGCDAAQRAAQGKPHKGPLAPTPKGSTVSVPVIAEFPGELVLLCGAGYQKGRPPENMRPILRFNPAAFGGWRKDSSAYFKRISLSRSMIEREIAKCGALVLCNGSVPKEGNHSVWWPGHIQILLSKGRISDNDPACLLGSGKCARHNL